MLKDLTYRDVPANFAFCLQSGCKRAEECLRCQAVGCLADAPAKVPVINPHHAVTDGECPHFIAIRKARFAVGMKNMFNALPYDKAKHIKKVLIDYFRNGTFYRMKDGKKHISLEDQAYIKSVFENYGVTSEPQYDGFADHYLWE